MQRVITNYNTKLANNKPNEKKFDFLALFLFLDKITFMM